MKKEIEKKSGSDKIRKAEEKNRKAKIVRELCDKIVWYFDMPSNQGLTCGPELSNVIDKVSPWQREASDEDGKFEKIWEGVKVSFGFGYALGRMLDIPDIDVTPIEDFLREEKALLYLPHRKAA